MHADGGEKGCSERGEVGVRLYDHITAVFTRTLMSPATWIE